MTQDLDSIVAGMSKDRRDYLEVFGNQWAPVKMMPGTCEACVWGRGVHSLQCQAKLFNVGDIVTFGDYPIKYRVTHVPDHGLAGVQFTPA